MFTIYVVAEQFPHIEDIACFKSVEDARAFKETTGRITFPIIFVRNVSNCPECDGTGQLIKLGGDWGKTQDTTIICWRCKGIGYVHPKVQVQ